MDPVQLGTITRLHGFRGAFVVETASGKESALGYLKQVFLEISKEEMKSLTIEEAAWMPKGWKVQVQEITTEAQAKELVGKTIFANREDLEGTEDDEYYVHDLIGATAKDEESGEELGIFERSEKVNGSQDRWWFRKGESSFSVPATKQYIARVDVPSKTIFLKWKS